MLTIDGARGEGGGQILRTALALSLLSGEPFKMSSIRARRKTPGLLRQHLTAVQAAAQVGEAEVSGAALGSTELTFKPKAVKAGAYRFAIGTAGSASLVLQTVLPPLLSAGGRSEVEIEGGTHNPLAPPFEFLAHAFLPVLSRIGHRVSAELVRPGFYPAGGGLLRVAVEPGEARALSLRERGAVRSQRAIALLSGVPYAVADRELSVVAERLGWPRGEMRPEVIRHARGPGNAVVAFIESEHVTEVFTQVGEKGRPAEVVAGALCDEVSAYLASGAPVGEHLADQLLLPLSLGKGGVFRTTKPSLHTTTQIDTLKLFLPVKIDVTTVDEQVFEVSVSR